MRLPAALPALIWLVAPLSRAASLLPESPFTDAAAGATSAPFLKIPVSARAGGLGASEAALGGDAASIFANPAGLAWVDRRELAFGYGQLLETSFLGSVAYAVPAGSRAWGLGARYFSQSALEALNAVQEPIGSFRPFDGAVGAAYARRARRWSAGVGLKAVHSKLDTESGTTVALDAGLLGRSVTVLGDGPVDVGVVVRHLGPPLGLGGRSDPLPFEAAAGFLWHAKRYLRFAGDARMPVDQKPYVSGGAELHREFTPGLSGAFRAGYSLHNARDVGGLSGWTAGASLGFKSLRLDYAWIAFGDLGRTHRASVAFRFGEPPANEAKEEPPASPSGGPERARTLVLKFEPMGLDSSWASAAAEFLADGLSRGRFDAPSPVEAERQLRAAGFPDAPCFDADCAVRAGRAFGAAKAVFGDLSYVGGSYYLKAELLDVATGVVEFSGTETARQPAMLRDAAMALARRIEAAAAGAPPGASE